MTPLIILYSPTKYSIIYFLYVKTLNSKFDTLVPHEYISNKIAFIKTIKTFTSLLMERQTTISICTVYDDFQLKYFFSKERSLETPFYVLPNYRWVWWFLSSPWLRRLPLSWLLSSRCTTHERRCDSSWPGTLSLQQQDETIF